MIQSIQKPGHMFFEILTPKEIERRNALILSTIPEHLLEEVLDRIIQQQAGQPLCPCGCVERDAN